METEMKIIQMKLANLSRFEQSWIEVFKKAPSNSTTFKELETAVDLYMKQKKDHQFGFSQHLTPLHVAAITNQATLYEKLVDIVDEKNPVDLEGNQPLEVTNRCRQKDCRESWLQIDFKKQSIVHKNQDDNVNKIIILTCKNN